MILEHPIKTLGLTQVRVVLHPEVSIPVTVNVARSTEEAEKQARGEAVGLAAEEDAAAEETLAVVERADLTGGQRALRFVEDDEAQDEFEKTMVIQPS